MPPISLLRRRGHRPWKTKRLPKFERSTLRRYVHPQELLQYFGGQTLRRRSQRCLRMPSTLSTALLNPPMAVVIKVRLMRHHVPCQLRFLGRTTRKLLMLSNPQEPGCLVGLPRLRPKCPAESTILILDSHHPAVSGGDKPGHRNIHHEWGSSTAQSSLLGTEGCCSSPIAHNSSYCPSWHFRDGGFFSATTSTPQLCPLVNLQR